MRRQSGAGSLHLIMVLVITAVLVYGSVAAVSADINGENGKSIPAAEIRIPVRHYITGDGYSGKDTFDFILATGDDKCPMPAGAVGRTITATTAGTADPDFGTIVLEYPDTYIYTVSRPDYEYRDLETDDQTYSVLIVKLNDGTASMVIQNERGEKVDEIVYTDQYISPGHSSPKTGDQEYRKQIIVNSLVAVSAAAGLALLFAAARIRKKNTCERRGGSL